MLSFFSVVEAYGLIYPRPSDKNSTFACLLVNFFSVSPPGGTHDIFGRGCATIKSLYRPFLEFLTKNLTLFGIFVPNGGLQSTILRAVLRKKWLPFSKNFPKIVDFLSKLGQRNQSIQSSFGLSFVSSK